MHELTLPSVFICVTLGPTRFGAPARRHRGSSLKAAATSWEAGHSAPDFTLVLFNGAGPDRVA